MAFHQLIRQQTLPIDLATAWEFLSRPENLQKITPPQMRFAVTTPDLPSAMYPGMIITYRVSPLPGIRLTWVSEITHIQEKLYFVDEQRSGPFALWHHEHILKPIAEGVMMTDIVSYKLPLGPLGEIAHKLIIRRQLESIFNYRSQAMEGIFRNP